MLGFDLIENFNRPFGRSQLFSTLGPLHISLTTWFRDYIFTPLSFYNRGLSGVLGKLQGWFNVFIIFPISGLWHGDNMGYVVWGVLNGFVYGSREATAKKRRQWAKKNILYRSRFLKALIQCSCVYLLFTICIVFFAASYYGQTASDGFYLFSHLFSNQGNSTLFQSGFGQTTCVFSPIYLVCHWNQCIICRNYGKNRQTRTGHPQTIFPLPLDYLLWSYLCFAAVCQLWRIWFCLRKITKRRTSL